MRGALSKEKLKGIYRRIAKRYDFQHAVITARADQRGRNILVDNSKLTGVKSYAVTGILSSGLKSRPRNCPFTR